MDLTILICLAAIFVGSYVIYRSVTDDPPSRSNPNRRGNDAYPLAGGGSGDDANIGINDDDQLPTRPKYNSLPPPSDDRYVTTDVGTDSQGLSHENISFADLATIRSGRQTPYSNHKEYAAIRDYRDIRSTRSAHATARATTAATDSC